MTSRRQFLTGLAASAGWICSRHFAFARSERALPDLRLGFYTDVHTRPGDEVSQALELAARTMAEEPVDHWICGGDIIHAGHQSPVAACEPAFTRYQTFVDGLGKPVHHVIGNHDLAGAFPGDGSPPAEDPRARWRAFTGQSKTYHAFDCGEYRLISLDAIELTGGETLYRGHIDSGQMKWLEQEIEALDPKQPVILATHIPFRTTFAQSTEHPNAGHPPNLVVENANEVLELFENRHLPLVLQGHLHSNEWIDWAGRKFLMGGAISGAWWRGPNRQTGFGYGTIRMGGNRIIWDYRGYGWPV